MITVEVLLMCMGGALFAGFVFGWKQCEQKYEREQAMRSSWKRLEEQAIRDHYTDNDDPSP